MTPLLLARIPAEVHYEIGRVLTSGHVGQGEVVACFESELAAWLGVDPDRFVMTNSGTSALFLALRLIGVEGSHVVTTPMTFIATTTAIYQAGARPIWTDLAQRSCQMALPNSALLRWQARALVAVCWAGYAPDLGALQQAAADASVPLLIDAAQALGARCNGRPVHEYGTFTAYSFAPTKHVTTGDGGALVCPDAATAARARRLAWFGMRRGVEPPERWPSDQNIPEAGFKLHMNDLTAAVGLAGLDDLDAALARARENAAIYHEAIGSEQSYAPEASPYTYTVFVEDPADFVRYMEAAGVVVGQPHRRNDANGFAVAERRDLPNTDWVQAHYCSIPVGWWIDDAEARRIAAAVRAYGGLLS